MPKRYTSKQVIRAFNNIGFQQISQKGSHIKFRGLVDGKLQTVIIPNHKQIAVGTFSSILRQANITKQEFEDNL